MADFPEEPRETIGFCRLLHGTDCLLPGSFRIVIQHDRRRLVHFNVTAHPTAEWTARQILEAFPFETAPKYLLRDRDGVYGEAFRQQVAIMNIKEVLSAPMSPWQKSYVERVIGSIRRECLDHVIILDEEGLRRVLSSYARYYHRSRLHLSLDKDSPDPRPVQPIARLLQFPRSAVCIIGTNGVPPSSISPTRSGAGNQGYAHRPECVRHTCARNRWPRIGKGGPYLNLRTSFPKIRADGFFGMDSIVRKRKDSTYKMIRHVDTKSCAFVSLW
jgi:hypothetical protein